MNYHETDDSTYDSSIEPPSNLSPTASSPKTSFPKNKIKVLLLESINQSAVQLFNKEEFQVETVHELSEDALCERIRDVHVLGIRSKTKLTPRVLSCAKRLLAIGAYCIGTDQIDLSAAATRGVAVFNAPFANTRSVAELMVAEMIMLARQLGDRNAECHRKYWNKKSGGCYEVRGKTLGIVGYGHVGSQLSILAEALGMRVLFYDIVPKLALGLAHACDSLAELLKASDFVSLHVPKTPETCGMIGEKELAMMKKGAYLLNASRGDVVDVNALASALESKHLAGAAVDVFPYEPASSQEEFNTPLQGCSNAIITPHIGGSTEEAQYNIGIEVTQKLISFVNTGSTYDAVNFPQISLPEDPVTHRLLNIHRNVPGVLRDINNVVSKYNVSAQVLRTRGDIGYLMLDIDSQVSHEVKAQISGLPNSIKTRILY